MRFLADENLGLEVIKHVRKLKHNITSITEISPGITDIEVLKLANNEDRILLTSDTDFGSLIFQQKQMTRGIVLLRLKDEKNANKIRIISLLLAVHSEQLKNHFVVVTETRVRIRELANYSN